MFPKAVSGDWCSDYLIILVLHGTFISHVHFFERHRVIMSSFFTLFMMHTIFVCHIFVFFLKICVRIVSINWTVFQTGPRRNSKWYYFTKNKWMWQIAFIVQTPPPLYLQGVRVFWKITEGGSKYSYKNEGLMQTGRVYRSRVFQIVLRHRDGNIL